MRTSQPAEGDPPEGSNGGAAGEPADPSLPQTDWSAETSPVPARVGEKDRSGAQIGPFVLQRLCGQGAMGVVYAAVDLRDGHLVAVKVMPAALFADHGRAARFAAEAEALASLDHPGIVRYIAHGVTPEGEPYLAMEWLEGEDLAARLARRGLSVREAVALGRRVAEALAAAHAQGVIHRDIKPSNIFLPWAEVEQARILDFGIARVAHAPRALTATGIVLGTPGYMAPEQARGDRTLDARADLFSLGAVLHECLAGRPPFAGHHVMAILLKVLLEVPPSLRELRPDAPGALADLVDRMLAKDGAARPASAAAVALELATMSLDAGESAPAGAPPRIDAIESLTGSERRFFCMIVAGAPRAGSDPSIQHSETVPDPSGSLHAALQQVASPYGARIQRLVDGSLLVALQASGSAADQVARAARCALVLRPLLPDVPLAIAAGLGEASGAVPVGEVVDRAAGLARETSAGAPVGVRVDGVTAGLLGARFVVSGGPDGRVLLDERDAGEDTRLLLGRPSPCVGRERELRAVADLLDECVSERIARAVLITAPTGIGKSRLLHEFLRAAQRRDDAISLWLGRADLLGAGSSFALVSSALHFAAQMHAGEAPEARRRKLEVFVARHVAEKDRERVAAFLGEMVGAPFPDQDLVFLQSARANPGQMADQVSRAFVDLLAAECAAGPVLLVLEDLHWGDLPSVRLIDAALAKLQDRPLLVIALGRPEVHDQFPRLWSKRNAQEIRLGALTRRAAEGLARDALGREVPAEVVDRIVGRAAGNAFYLEELIRAVAEGRDQELPETVLAMVQARLDALEIGDRRVLRAASVFGETLWAGGVRALLGDEPGVEERLAAMVEREILIRHDESRFPGEDELAFRHALLREGAYSTLTDRDRALGHRLAGAWLEERGEGDPMVMVQHFERGGEPHRAETYCLRAARQAYLGNDPVAAAARAEQGLRLGDSGERRVDLLIALSMAVHALGDLDAAAARIEDVLRLAPPGSRAVCTALAGKLLIGQQRGAPHVLMEVMDAVRDVTPTPENAGPLMQIYWPLLIVLPVMGCFDLAQHYRERFEQAVVMVPPLDLAAQGCIHAIRAERALSYEGDIERAVKLWERGAACSDEAGDRSPAVVQRAYAGWGYRLLGAYDRSEEVLRRAGESIFGASLEGWMVSILRAWTLADRGALDAAIVELTRTLGEAPPQTEMGRQCFGRTVLAHALRLRGDLDAAAREAEAALELPPLFVLQRSHLLATLGAVRLAQGRTNDALAAVDEAIRAIDSSPVRLPDEPVARRVQIEVLIAAGDQGAARVAMALARDRLLMVAAKIQDPALRRSFCEDVADNARTLQLAEEWLGPA